MPGMLEYNILKLMANRNEESLSINIFVVFKKKITTKTSIQATMSYENHPANHTGKDN